MCAGCVWCERSLRLKLTTLFHPSERRLWKNRTADVLPSKRHVQPHVLPLLWQESSGTTRSSLTHEWKHRLWAEFKERPRLCRSTTLSLWLPSSSSTSPPTKTWTSSVRSTPTAFLRGAKETSLPDECPSSWGSTLITRLTFFHLLLSPFSATLHIHRNKSQYSHPL